MTMASQNNTSNMLRMQEEIKRLQQLQRLRAATTACSFPSVGGGAGLLPGGGGGSLGLNSAAGANDTAASGLVSGSSAMNMNVNAALNMNNMNNIDCFTQACGAVGGGGAGGGGAGGGGTPSNPVLVNLLQQQQQQQQQQRQQQQQQQQQEETRLMLLQHQVRLNAASNNNTTNVGVGATGMGAAGMGAAGMGMTVPVLQQSSGLQSPSGLQQSSGLQSSGLQQSGLQSPSLQSPSLQQLYSNRTMGASAFSDLSSSSASLPSPSALAQQQQQQQLQLQFQRQSLAAQAAGGLDQQFMAGRPLMRVGAIEPFPEKLHRMLMEVEQVGRTDVISFINHGRGFAIHKPDTFFKEIVPLYFRHSRLSSFKRQLNLYGFEQINIGPFRGGYYHEMFHRDQPEMCRRMRRVAVKVSGATTQRKKEQQEAAKAKAEEKTASAEEKTSSEGQHG